MSQIKTNMLKFVQRVDPRRKDNGQPFSSADVGNADGDRFTVQRQLDIYNEARVGLLQALRAGGASTKDLAPAIKEATIASVSGVIALPNDFVEPIGHLVDGSGVRFWVYGPDLEQTARARTLPIYTLSTDNRFVIFRDNQFVCPGVYTSFMPNGPFTFSYYGLKVIILSDVTNNTPPLMVEDFSEKYTPVLLEIAQAIADEQGQGQVMALAMSLVGKKAA